MLIVERDGMLEELKVHGRDPRNADPIFTKEVHIPPKTGLFIERHIDMFKGNRDTHEARIR